LQPFQQASYLAAIVKGEASSPILSKDRAVELLGTMQVNDTTEHSTQQPTKQYLLKSEYDDC